MNKKDLKKKSKTDWKKIDAKRDKDIDFSDIPEQGDDFFEHAELKMPQKKTIISIRVDSDVLRWFKAQGHGYQTRIGALLRAYKEVHSQT